MWWWLGDFFFDFGGWILDFGFWILNFGFWILDFVGGGGVVRGLTHIPH